PEVYPFPTRRSSDLFGDDVADHFQSIWDSVVLVFETFKEVFMGLGRAWSAVFRGDWEAAWTELKGVAATIWNTIPEVVSGIINRSEEHTSELSHVKI